MILHKYTPRVAIISIIVIFISYYENNHLQLVISTILLMYCFLIVFLYEIGLGEFT